MKEEGHRFLHTLSRSSKKAPLKVGGGGDQGTDKWSCHHRPHLRPPITIKRVSQHQILLICTFLPQVSEVGDSLAIKGQNKTLYRFCSQITVLWAMPFFQISYPLWTARGNSWMIQATGSDPLFRNSFLGVSLHAQGTA